MSQIQLPIVDKQIVENLIPQKKPFVMVSELLDYNESYLQSGFVVSEQDIFESNGYFQASGVLEHQAQSVALHTGYLFSLKNEQPPVGYIGAVKYFDIKSLPKINDRIVTDVAIMSEFMGVTLVKVTSKIGDEIIATSEMKTVIK